MPSCSANWRCEEASESANLSRVSMMKVRGQRKESWREEVSGVVRLWGLHQHLATDELVAGPPGTSCFWKQDLFTMFVIAISVFCEKYNFYEDIKFNIIAKMRSLVETQAI